MILIMETNSSYTVVNDATPAYPLHPGCTLKEELAARGIRQKVFAAQIGIQATHLSAIIHGKRDITPAVAAKLELGLPEISANIWIKLQENYNLDVQRCRIRTSSLVAGYKPDYKSRQIALAEPDSEYNGQLHVNVVIPSSDRELLEIIAMRFGWVLQK